MLYFDHNATTPLLPVAREAWLAAAADFVGNPSSPHRLGSRADRALSDARTHLATWLGCDPMDLVWTSGATEANNMVLHHAARSAPPDAEVWVSAIEHPCVLAATRRYFPGRHRFVPVRPDGVIDLAWFQARLAEGPPPALVAVMAANNETGVLQPWPAVLAACRAAGVPFFCDAAQWLGKLPAAGLGACEFVSGCAHKFGGPRGIGFLKCPPRGPFHALLHGGEQEAGRRAGTENVAGALALVAALRQREAELAAGGHHERARWRARWAADLPSRVPGARVLGAGADTLWNTLSVLLPAADCRRRWVVQLDKAGFAVSTGSACASGREEPSHVLAAMGVPAADSGRALRFSAGWETTPADWEQLAQALAALASAATPAA